MLTPRDAVQLSTPGLKNLELRSARPRDEWPRFMLIHECDQFSRLGHAASQEGETWTPLPTLGQARGILPLVVREPPPSPYLVLSQWMRTVSGAADVGASPPRRTGHGRHCTSA